MKSSWYPATTYQESWSEAFTFGLCASKNSLTSWWVEDEIKTTLEKERALRKERGKLTHKLIPLNLDGYMFTDEWDFGVLANEIKSRVAANFQGWEANKQSFDAQVRQSQVRTRLGPPRSGPLDPADFRVGSHSKR